MITETKIERIKRQANGRWSDVVARLVPDMEKALAKVGRHVACPVHGGNDGFRLFKDFEQTGGGACNTCGIKADGIALVAWATGSSTVDTLRMVDDCLNGHQAAPTKAVSRSKAKPVKEEDGSGKSERLIEVWDGASTSLSDLAFLRSYLTNRGLPGHVLRALEGVARLHSALPFYDKTRKTFVTYPTMVSRIQSNADENISLHRTYLAFNATKGVTKAPVDKPKRILPLKEGAAFPGCAIRVGGMPHNGVLNVAEGIETALAVIAMNGGACWSLINANNMKSFRPPAGIKKVVIWADADRAVKQPNGDLVYPGQDAAWALKEALEAEGLVVVVKLPNGRIPPAQKSLDWLDVWNTN